MKKLLIVVLAVQLTGCADMDPERRQRMAQAFAIGFNARANHVQQQPTAYQMQPPKQTDYRCQQQCLDAGYQYGLCDSKCTY